MKHLYNCLIFLITGSMGLYAQPFTVSIDNLPNPAPYEYCPPATTSATIQMLITGTVLPGPYTVILATNNGPNQTIIVPDNGSNVFSFNLSPTQNIQYTVLSVRSGNNTPAILVPPLIFSVTPCPPPVQLSAPPSACTGTPITLSATLGYANYQWSTGANGTSNSVVVTPSATGTTTYTVTVTTAGGLVSTAQASVVVSSSASLNPVICCNTAICNGSPVTLNVNNGPYGFYNWSTGGTGVTTSVNTPATYTVTVTQLNGSCTATATLTIDGGSSPVVSISGPPFVCSAGPVTLAVSPGGATSYVWSTGATTTFQNYNLNNVNGTYSVTVTGTNGCTGTASITVPQGAPPVGSIVGTGPPPQSYICANDPQFLSFQPAAATYLWDNGATTQSIPYPLCGYALGSYYHYVTVTDQVGCSASFISNSTPLYAFFYEMQTETVCEGQPIFPSLYIHEGVNFFDPIEVVLTDGVNTYTDTLPDPIYGYAFGPLYLPAGTYILSFVSVRRLLSGCEYYLESCLTLPNNLNYTVVVEANNLPPLSVTGGGAVCNGQPVLLTASPGFTQYSWSNGGTGQSISVNTPGTYTVYASNGGVCNSSASISVASIPFTPPVIVGPPSVCPGQPATLSINNATYSSYEWSSGGSGSSIIATAPGNYTATVTSAAGCTGTASFTLGSLTIPNVSISNVPNICPGQTVTLNANGGTAYVWNTGQTTANIIVTAGGSFTVTATASNGCTATATSSILQRPLPTVQFVLPQSDICGGDCVTVQVTLTGTAPFSLTYSVASGAAITAIFSGTTGTVQVCVPVGTALGPLQIQATSLTDAWCNCN